MTEQKTASRSLVDRPPQAAECGHEGTAVFWNPFNEEVQCHVCGAVYHDTVAALRETKQLRAAGMQALRLAHMTSFDPPFHQHPVEECGDSTFASILAAIRDAVEPAVPVDTEARK